MKTLVRTILLILVLITIPLVFATSHTIQALENGHANNTETRVTNKSTKTEEEKSVPLQRTGTTGRLLAGERTRRPSAVMTCDKYPRVCRAKGSAGPDCCKRRCVDASYDRLNCGMCGKKCRFWEICCRGNCVNPNSDERNCGSCDNRCKKGNSCTYGMCSYAN